MPSSSESASRVEQNRTAASIAGGSLVVIVGVAIAYWGGVLESLIPPGGPAADAIPLIVVVSVLLVALVVWSWGRVLSWLG
ncbi:hypothetical protein [Natronobiforma cellulositropha]|uniref:hypothetical protein n=1 Tax=Natronobiforma cellulositropha TaxID=1679076 RepID=UPI0021D60F32|nr:hypothetical protein [Natronobiforma cellulositropha]